MALNIKRKTVDSVEDFEKQFEKKTRSTNYKYPVRVKDRLRVHFLTEPNQWVQYEQYWDPALGRPVIATEENEEAYKARNIKSSPLYLAAALDVKTAEVIVVELKYSLAKEIAYIIKEKKDEVGPLTSYDVELVKRGTTKDDTEYRANYDGRSDLDVSRYPAPAGFTDWQAYLWNVVEFLINGTAGEEEDPIADDTDYEPSGMDEFADPSKKKKLTLKKTVNA